MIPEIASDQKIKSTEQARIEDAEGFRAFGRVEEIFPRN